jgi:hypothetical protein
LALIAGLLTRRLSVIAIAAVAWGILLLAVGVIGISEFPLAALVGGANTAVGVFVHRVVAWSLRRARRARARPIA